MAVGRAVWKEAGELTGQARADFLQGEARQRMERVTALCNALARPWTDFYDVPEVEPDWYEKY